MRMYLPSTTSISDICLVHVVQGEGQGDGRHESVLVLAHHVECSLRGPCRWPRTTYGGAEAAICVFRSSIIRRRQGDGDLVDDVVLVDPGEVLEIRRVDGLGGRQLIEGDLLSPGGRAWPPAPAGGRSGRRRSGSWRVRTRMWRFRRASAAGPPGRRTCSPSASRP